MSLSTTQAIRDIIQNEQAMLKKFDCISKTMEHIVFLACGDEYVGDGEVTMRVGNLSMLYYYLWKIYEAQSEHTNYIYYNAMRMFLLPVMHGTWKEEGELEPINLPQRAFEACCEKTYTTTEAIHEDVYNWWAGITRNSTTENFKAIKLNKRLPKDSDFAKTYQVVHKSLKGESANRNLLLVVIITAYICCAMSKKQLSYHESMSILFRLALLLSGQEFIDEMDNEGIERLNAIDVAVAEYNLLPAENVRTVGDEICFLFGFNVADSKIPLLPIEREIFRITQRLYRLCDRKGKKVQRRLMKKRDVEDFVVISNASLKKPQTRCKLADIVNELYETSSQRPDYKLGYDEENFYFLLARRKGRREEDIEA